MRLFLFLALIANLSPQANAVYGGLVADTKQFRFVRFLEITQKDGNMGGCSGTLLERGMVLTAAHCVIDKSNQRVKKIVVKTNRSDPRGYEAWGANVHADYRPGGQSLNDIAILYTMIGDDTFSGKDGQATLPIDYAWAKYQKENRKAYYPAFLNLLSVNHLRDIFAKSIPRDPQGNLWAYAVGFGLTCPEATCPTMTNSARYVGKLIYPMDGRDCQKTAFDFTTAPKRFCALTGDASITRPSTTDGKSNINYGDSGGPLFSFTNDGTAVVIGIVNAGNGIYEAFTSVYDQLEFIRKSVNSPHHDSVRGIWFGKDSKDSAEPKIENAPGLNEVVPLLKNMLSKYDHRKSGNRVGSAVQDLWADEINYSGKMINRDQLRAMLDKFAARWPQRSYHLNKVRKSSTCLADQCTVVADIIWSTYRGDEEQGAVTVYTWVMRRQGSDWRIVSQSTRAMTQHEED